MSFDKFVWIKTLAADPDNRLTPSCKFILIYAAQVNVRFGDDALCVRQATLATNCATTERQVGRAYTAAEECGYLVLAQERQRGRGYTRADEYRLAFPHGIPDNLSGLSGEIPDIQSGIQPEIPDKRARNTGQNGREYRTNSSEIPDKANSSTSANDTPKGFKKGFTKGFEEGSGQTPRATAEEQLHAPGGAGLDEKKPRPALSGKFHGVLKSTNIARAGNPLLPKRNGTVPGNGVVPEKLDPWIERQAGISDCELCDDDGYLPDNTTQCWHGKTPAA